MGERILVIDDEALILSSIERALSKVGYEITAVKELEDFRNAIISGNFALIITDLHMEGINTDRLILEAKSRIPEIKVLTISGSVGAEDSKYFLQKPFRISSLREKVREILNEPSRD